MFLKKKLLSILIICFLLFIITNFALAMRVQKHFQQKSNFSKEPSDLVTKIPKKDETKEVEKTKQVETVKDIKKTKKVKRKVNGISLLQAVNITLHEEPSIKLVVEDVNASKGQLQKAKGKFDFNLNTKIYHQEKDAYQYNGLFGKQNRQIISGTSVSIDKMTRYGISFGPSLDSYQVEDINDINMVVGETFYPDVYMNDTNLSFKLNVPLLKGSGEKAAAADELAAEVNFFASKFTLKNAVAKSIMNSSAAYWNYLGAVYQLNLMKNLEKDSLNILNDVKILAKEDAKPKSDINTFTADYSKKVSQRISAEQGLINARQKFGLAMGLRYEEIHMLPFPEDKFPRIDVFKQKGYDVDHNLLFEYARENRGDYLAAKKSENSAKILLDASKKNVLPQLDVNASVGYAGARIGSGLNNYLASYSDEVMGPTYSISLLFDYPFENNEAEGDVISNRSSFKKSLINKSNVERQIYSDLVVNINELRNYVLEYDAIKNSIENYIISVNDEKIKFKLGMASVIDVINMEDQLTNVQLQQINTMVGFATSLVNLSYNTGALIVSNGDFFKVDFNKILSLLNNKKGNKNEK